MQINFALLTKDALKNEIRQQLIGDNDYHAKQLEVFDEMEKGKNVFAIFPTGRGKSAIFQAEAAFRAITEKKITILLYPLKALINDQFEKIQQLFNPFHLIVRKADGSLNRWEREAFFHAVEYGDVDIILTNPEFLLYNLVKFEDIMQRVDFIVIDEAHHMTDIARTGYQQIQETLAFFQHPQVLALTATSNEQTTELICDRLGIQKIVLDKHRRFNLNLTDMRDCYANDAEKLNHIEGNIRLAKGKCIVYTTTRQDAERYAQHIHHSSLARYPKTAFYHAGMSKGERLRVEQEFKSGQIKVITATSAFGEGVNIPDISDVFLPSFSFDFESLNQQSGRAGRDGSKASVHLLFSRDDAKKIWRILYQDHPVYAINKAVYENISLTRLLDPVITYGQLKAQKVEHLTLNLVEQSLKILRECGVILPSGEIMDVRLTKDLLLKSETFAYGDKQLAKFGEFRDIIMDASKDEIQKGIQQPICPFVLKVGRISKASMCR